MYVYVDKYETSLIAQSWMIMAESRGCQNDNRTPAATVTVILGGCQGARHQPKTVYCHAG